ncbi:MAG: helix-turn-helix domain-containing protein, partial [Planctomycetota bacterium]
HELIDSLYDLRPIRSGKAYKEAMKALTTVMRVARRNKDQNDYLETLSGLIGEYEAKTRNVSVEEDPIGNLRFLLEENDMTASDLGRLLGDRSLGTRVLKGERSLSKTHIKVLSRRFRVSPALFI